MPAFYERFIELRETKKSLLCVGLDPDPALLPDGYNQTLDFLTDVILATKQYAVAYKPNLAFYEAAGVEGWKLFYNTISCIKNECPECLIIADAKRGDVGNTAKFYAKAFFEQCSCDAITISPYMGEDSITPFAEYKDKATIVLCLTSNPGASVLQMEGNPPLFQRTAKMVNDLNKKYKNLWMVVGATRDSNHIKTLRNLSPEVPFLVPGIGAQGGDLEAVMQNAGRDLLINASRSIMYASSNREKVRSASTAAAREMTESIRKYL